MEVNNDFEILPQPVAPLTMIVPQGANIEQNEIKSNDIPILKGFKQRLPTQTYLDQLENLNGGRTGFIGENPLLSIHFKDLQLNGIESVLEKASGDLKGSIHSFKNYLLWKRKGNEEPSLISVLPVMSSSMKLEYSLQVDREFLQKLEKCLWEPSIKIELVVEGKRQLPRTATVVVHVFQLANVDRENVLQFYFEGEAKVSELLEKVSGEDKKDGIRIALKSKKESSELTIWLAQFGPNLTFTWDIKVEFGEAQNKKELKIRSNLILQKLYNLDEESKDVIIIAANGAEIKCHKNILIAQSESFHSMLFPEYEMMEVQTGKIEMKENSEEGLKQFVKLLYGFSLPVETITCEVAVEVFQLANKYGVKELECCLMDFLCLKEMQFFNADTILELYFIARNVECLGELKAHALLEMSKLSEETLTGCEYFKKLPRDDAVNLLFTLLQWKN